MTNNLPSNLSGTNSILQSTPGKLTEFPSRRLQISQLLDVCWALAAPIIALTARVREEHESASGYISYVADGGYPAEELRKYLERLPRAWRSDAREAVPRQLYELNVGLEGQGYAAFMGELAWIGGGGMLAACEISSDLALIEKLGGRPAPYKAALQITTADFAAADQIARHLQAGHNRGRFDLANAWNRDFDYIGVRTLGAIEDPRCPSRYPLKARKTKLLDRVAPGTAFSELSCAELARRLQAEAGL